MNENKFNISCFGFFLVLLIFSMPLVSRAQENSVQVEAMTAAESDANQSVNRLTFIKVVVRLLKALPKSV
ncbi:MAG: hypothetical protein OXN25_01410, partial [Candidatus Poribacteria bacterium]|nr:hypothetical protein [Candidatus Poribacteria bacterium]